MAGIAMMIGGAVVNALAFTGSNFLFSGLANKRIDEERKRHDLALEKLTQAKQEWEQQRVKYLDYLNQRMLQQKLSEKTFANVDEALREYNEITGENYALPPEPKLSDFYTPSDDQQIRELTWVLAGTAIVGYAVYKFI